MKHFKIHISVFHSQNKLGDTPLHSAAWKGHPAAVAALLEKGTVNRSPVDTDSFQHLVSFLGSREYA